MNLIFCQIKFFKKTENLFNNLCTFFDVEPTKELEKYFNKDNDNIAIYKLISSFGFTDYSYLDRYCKDENVNKLLHIYSFRFNEKTKDFIMSNDVDAIRHQYYMLRKEMDKYFFNIFQEIINEKKKCHGEEECFNQLMHSNVLAKAVCYYYEAAKLLKDNSITNFIINNGNATYEDITQLIELIKKKVKKEYNIDLILEQEIIW